jgi:hypothetical protein
MGRIGSRVEWQWVGRLRGATMAATAVTMFALAAGCGNDDEDGDGGPKVEQYCQQKCEADSGNTCCKAGTDGCITVSYAPCYEVCVDDNTEHRKTCQSTVDAYTACATSTDWACEDGTESPVACDDAFLNLWCCLNPSSDVCE